MNRRLASALPAIFLSACVSAPPAARVSVPFPYSPPVSSAARAPVGTAVALRDGVIFTAVDFSALPSWTTQSFPGSLKAFVKGCERLRIRPHWTAICAVAEQTPGDNRSARLFFENNFTPWTVSRNGRPDGKVTGYYEPAVAASRVYSAAYPYPVYALPDDFVSLPYQASLKGRLRMNVVAPHRGEISATGAYTVDLSLFPVTSRTRALKGRIVGNRFLPYHTRAEIQAGALRGKAEVIAYAADAVALFFLQVQGSGRLIFPDGGSLRLSYADKNNHPYVSIGRYMVERGYLTLDRADAAGIGEWLAAHPGRRDEILAKNPAFVFFKPAAASDDGPVGALGVPLTAGFSAAVDRHVIALGSPLFVATVDPRHRRALNRLMVAQDTGSAIVGAVRVDFFWGYGAEAGVYAGKMNEVGYVWNLLPNGMTPTYDP